MKESMEKITEELGKVVKKDRAKEKPDGKKGLTKTTVKKKDIVKEYCRVYLSDEEIMALGDSNAELVRQIENLNDEKSRITTDFSSRTKELELRLKNGASTVRDKFEMRNVECERIYDGDAGKVFFMCTKTGKVVKERLMTESDRQIGLDLKEGVAT